MISPFENFHQFRLRAGALRRPQRHSAVPGRDLRVGIVEYLQVRSDRFHVAAGHRTRERGRSSPQHVVQRGGEQRLKDSFGDSARCAVHDLLADIPVQDIRAFESGLFSYLDTDPTGREVMQAVRDTGDLSAQAEEQLRAVLAAFTERFRSAE